MASTYKRWRDLSPARRAVVMSVAAVDLGLRTWALVDLRRRPAELTTESPAAQAAFGPFTFSAGRRLRSTSAHVRNPRSTAATDITVARRAGERSRHRRDFDAITVLLVRRTGRCEAMLRCATPNPATSLGRGSVSMRP